MYRRLKPFCLNKNTKRCTRELIGQMQFKSMRYYILIVYEGLRSVKHDHRLTNTEQNTETFSSIKRYSPFMALEIRRKRFCSNQSRLNLRFFSLALALCRCFVFNGFFSAFKICAFLFEPTRVRSDRVRPGKYYVCVKGALISRPIHLLFCRETVFNST